MKGPFPRLPRRASGWGGARTLLGPYLAPRASQAARLQLGGGVGARGHAATKVCLRAPGAPARPSLPGPGYGFSCEPASRGRETAGPSSICLSVHLFIQPSVWDALDVQLLRKAAASPVRPLGHLPGCYPSPPAPSLPHCVTWSLPLHRGHISMCPATALPPTLSFPTVLGPASRNFCSRIASQLPGQSQTPAPAWQPEPHGVWEDTSL